MGQFADDHGLWVKPKACPKQRCRKGQKALAKLLGYAASKVITKLEELGFKVNIEKTQSIFFHKRKKYNKRKNIN